MHICKILYKYILLYPGKVVLTHKVLSACLLSSPHLPQSVCHILSQDQTLQMTALLPGK